MNFRLINHIFCLTFITIALMLSGALMIHLGFWQLNKIQEEQTIFNKLSGLSAPETSISDFAFIRTSGKLVENTHGSFYQIKQPHQIGYAHFALFKTANFNDLLVLYDWSPTPTSQKPIPITVEGKALPFQLLYKQKIIIPETQTWENLLQNRMPTHFIVSTHYPNLSHFQLFYQPKLATHYNYAFQFFLIGITLNILAGYVFYRKTQ